MSLLLSPYQLWWQIFVNHVFPEYHWGRQVSDQEGTEKEASNWIKSYSCTSFLLTPNSILTSLVRAGTYNSHLCYIRISLTTSAWGSNKISLKDWGTNSRIVMLYHNLASPTAACMQIPGTTHQSPGINTLHLGWLLPTATPGFKVDLNIFMPKVSLLFPR